MKLISRLSIALVVLASINISNVYAQKEPLNSTLSVRHDCDDDKNRHDCDDDKNRHDCDDDK